MGRIFRVRKRKKKLQPNHPCVNSTKEYLELIDWMKRTGWKPSCKLVSAYFQNTGRGLMAKKKIVAGSALAQIPYQLLITVKTVLESGIRWIFDVKRFFTTQQVLSTFLVWEAHLEKLSTWKNYINCLPATFSCPAFCDDVSWLPTFLLEKAEDTRRNISKTYSVIRESIESKKCDHCGEDLSSIFTFHKYVWAWFIVNTRAVYLCPQFNAQDCIMLSDENNLALAPYIDLFNHSYAADVKSYVIESEGVYQIETGVPFDKNSEVFINYGPLSNDRLFMEYGFIIPTNIQDSVVISYDNVLQAANDYTPLNKHINEYRCKFLREKGLFTNISCYAGGLSWDCQALIYVFSCAATCKIDDIKQNIFSNRFKKDSWETICDIGKTIVAAKLGELERELQALSERRRAFEMFNECFVVANNLLKEYIKLLNQCYSCLSEKSD